MNKNKVFICLLLVCLCFQMISAQMIPESVHVKIMIKIISYDKNMPTYAQSGIKIGVVTDPANNTSKDIGIKVYDVIKKFETSGSTVKGIKILANKVESIDPSQIQKAVEDKGINYLYITPGTFEIDPIITKAKELGIPTMSVDENFIKKGVNFGVLNRSNKPKIVVNKNTCKELGIDFSASLLKLAEII